MNRDPILFRVDGTQEAGWERLQRCLTFAGALQRRRRPTYFLSRLEPGHLGLSLKRAGNEWLQADEPVGTEDDLAETLQEIRRIRPAAIVVDSANLSDGYLSELVSAGPLVVAIDHQAATRFASQLVINPALDPGRDAYDVHSTTQLLLGRRYAIVRPEVRRIRQMRAQEPAQPFRALVALGEDDPHQSLTDLIKLLVPISRLGHIDVVVRPQYSRIEEIQSLAGDQGERLEIVAEPTEITSRIARCHFAITAGGNWALELACVGVPQLLIVRDESYWPTARRLEDEGAASCIGEPGRLSSATLRHAVNELLGDPLERQAMSRCGRKLIDGRGPDRLVTALEVMLHPSRAIDLREVA